MMIRMRACQGRAHLWHVSMEETTKQEVSSAIQLVAYTKRPKPHYRSDSRTNRLQGSSDVLDYNDGKTRASLAQTLAINCNSQSCPAFTLVANHFKSKGSACDDLDDPDANDGQVSIGILPPLRFGLKQ